MGVQDERIVAPVRKRRSARVVPSSDEETTSDDVGLRPRKVRRTLSMGRLLGSIGMFLATSFWRMCRKMKFSSLILQRHLHHRLLQPPRLILVLTPHLGVHLVHPGFYPVKETFSGG